MDRKPIPFKRGERLPRFIPQWIKRRVETDLYLIYDFSEEAASKIAPGDRVLDAGAGQGRFKADFVHTRYFGVDLAVGDSSWNYSNLDAISDLTNLPFQDSSFDAVLCTQVLEHVPEPQLVINEIARVLKPRGQLFLSAPQSWCQHQKPHDYFRYTSFGLDYLFSKAGLKAEEIRPMGGYFWFLSFQLQNINYWLFPKGKPGRFLTWPIRALLAFIFQILTPLLLYYLDSLDHVKDETFGYLCIAAKPDSS
jgi:SAM-dependent methyltransferase